MMGNLQVAKETRDEWGLDVVDEPEEITRAVELLNRLDY